MATHRLSMAAWAGCVGASTFGAAWQGYCYLFPWYKSPCFISSVDSDVLVWIRARRRPPPIGQVLYPSSRALAELVLYAEEESRQSGPPTVITEIGSGCGLTAIALAAHGHRVLATDMCPDALTNLSHNVAMNAEVIARAGGRVFVKHVTAKNSGAESPSSLSTPPSLPTAHASAPDERSAVVVASTESSDDTALPWLPPNTRWLIGADLVYHGGAQSSGLSPLLATALREHSHKNLRVLLIVADRFSGG
eukprot:CAMPEP_0171682586 /NCGR_PEP_ID=MMETSP0991-20121206/623_1 /TAXON_ID=483369 /ORGANISM="non described non described, Strain CCMP2098" /LENGTH=249 /DNA_ID=CAMNT_0012269835 /DNA_START=75 /DNA_END=820 /DNA_ORIENTATION=-